MALAANHGNEGRWCEQLDAGSRLWLPLMPDRHSQRHSLPISHCHRLNLLPRLKVVKVVYWIIHIKVLCIWHRVRIWHMVRRNWNSDIFLICRRYIMCAGVYITAANKPL